MSKERIETGPAPALSVSCQGDLVIKGWDETAIGVRGEYNLDESGKHWAITSMGDLVLHIPHETALHIAGVAGDLVVKYSGGDVAIDSVKGDTVLRGLASAKVGTVHGDVSLRQSTGPARFETVYGDLNATHIRELSVSTLNGDLNGRHIMGAVTIESAGGDINLRTSDGPVTVLSSQRDVNLSGVTGEVNARGVQGDIRLKGGLTAGNHVLIAERDIVVRWPAEMPINLIATAPAVNNRATLDEFEQKGEAWIGRIGDSKTNVELTAGRQIQIKDAEAIDPRWEDFDEHGEDFAFAFDFANMGDRISAQVNEKIELFTHKMEQQFGPNFGREIGEKMARKAEQAAQRAEKAAERARAQGERGARWQDFPPPAPSAAPPPPKPASPEEQLKILRMVEKGTISPEEASMLLEALEA